MVIRILCVTVLAVLLSGCEGPYQRERPVVGQHLTVEAKDLAGLDETQFLMRKATLGSRPERLEAIEVIQRSNDPALYMFLIERLKVEDDRYIQIRIMRALANAGDVRAVPVLRRIARWDETRVGIEAMAALYNLGDDSMMLTLIDMLKANEDNPEIPSIAYQALRNATGATSIPPTRRAWTVWYQTHRITPYEATPINWPFRNEPLPKVVDGSTKIDPALRAKPALPDHDVRVRRSTVQFSDFWKNEAP
jgi:hypothetical protein